MIACVRLIACVVESVGATVLETVKQGRISHSSTDVTTRRDIKNTLARVVESVDTRDLKSLAGNTACGFKSRPGHKETSDLSLMFSFCQETL